MITHKDLAALKLTARPFTREGWVFELKYDGFRALGAHDVKGVRLVSRKGTDLLPCFPEVAACLEELPRLVIDGELVVLDDRGRPQFDRLQRRFRMKREDSVKAAACEEPAVLFAFDLLQIGSADLRREPLLERKARLERLLRGSSRIRFAGHIKDAGEVLFKNAEAVGLEGIVAKRADSLYYRGRDSGWLKIKTAAGRATDQERRKWNE